LIQDDKLKILIYQWAGQFKSYEIKFERYEKKVDNDVVPYLSKNYSMKDIDIYGNLKWKNKSQLNVNKIGIFTDIEFENLLDDLLYRLIKTKERTEQLKITIDEIINATAPNHLKTNNL